MNPADPNILIAGGTLIIAAASAYAGWAARILRGESAAKKVDSLEGEVGRIKSDIADFKVHVAANYASNSTIEQMESRLIEAINRLGDRLDRVLEPRQTRGRG